MNKCCYYCRHFRCVETEGQIADKKSAGACRFHGILIGMGLRKHLSPVAFGCAHWRADNDGK
jgi:hypothetical protein